MSPGDPVRVKGRKGTWTLVKPIPGGWQLLGPDQAFHAIRDAHIKETR